LAVGAMATIRHGVKTAKKRPLQPPWVERPLFMALLRQLTGKGYLRWQRLVAEAEALKIKVKARELVWPPSSANSASLLTGAATAVMRVDPMSPVVAGELPCMRSLFGTAIARLSAGFGPADPHAQQQFFNSLLTTYHGLIIWRTHSRHVLRVHPTLFEDFAHGEPAAIKGTDLFLPVPALYLEFPRGITMLDPLDETRRLNVRGALLTSENEDGEEYPRRELRVAIIGRRKPRWPTGVDPLVTFRMGLEGRSLVRPKTLPDGIAERIHVPAELPRGHRALEDPTRSEPAPKAPNDILVILVRLLDYLNSTPGDTHRRRGRFQAKLGGARQQAKAPHETTSTYWSVGSSHARSANAGGWRHGKPLTYVVHVRGHIRNQAWGPGHRLRRKMRIKSHQRGLRHGGAGHTTVQRLTRPTTG
jgi:hypothetical protein